MALVPYPSFVGGSYMARSPNFDAEEALNLYPEVAQVGTAKNIAALYGTPGSRTWCSFPNGPVRGMHRVNNTTSYVVSGAIVYKVTNLAVTTAIGTIPGSDRVTFANNGTQVVIAAGGLLYVIVIATSAFSVVGDTDFLGAGQVGFIGGYFVWNVPGTGQSQYSDLYSTDVGPLSFFTAEGSPDNGVGVIVDHLEYWYFGERTVEVFGITADPDAPLQRISGAFVEHGCASALSIAKMDNTIYWLGSDDTGAGIVWRATGAYEPQRVSTHAIEYLISQTADLSQADAWTYQQDGHAFYVLTVGDSTMVFDASTGLWHTRAWRDSGGDLHRVRGWCQMSFADKMLVGDWELGKLYELRLDLYDDDGAPLIARRAAGYLMARTYNALQIDFETGVGLSTGQGTDPQAMLQWSDDGGHTWSTEHWADIGPMGEYQTRVRWRRLGTPRKHGLPRMFRVTISDPVKRAITGAWLDAQ